MNIFKTFVLLRYAMNIIVVCVCVCVEAVSTAGAKAGKGTVVQNQTMGWLICLRVIRYDATIKR